MMGSANRMLQSDLLPLVLPVFLVMTVVMILLWAVQRTTRNAAIGDVGWCVGLIVAVLWYATQASGSMERIFLTVMLVMIYAGRLGLYILFNRVLGKQEDARYRRLREEWGESESAKILAYFLLQALAVVAFSLPALVLMRDPLSPFTLVELVGLLIWGVAVCGEAMADRQLTRFRADPQTHGHVCREGLWAYSRHPNYFFEWLHWCSYVVMTLGTPGWLLTWIGPIGMGLALIRITGIPRAEAQALSSRGEEYKVYQATTSAFFPWFSRPRSERP